MSSACTAELNSTIASPSSFITWFQGYRTILSVFAQITTDPNTAQQTTLTAVQTGITNMKSCLQQKINANANVPTTISNNHDDILSLQDEIKQEEINASIAKDRVESIRHPEQNVSNYESWFPIDHPLQKITVIVLISINIFMFTFLFLMMMSLAGYDVYLYTQPRRDFIQRSSFGWLYSQLTPPFWIALVVIISIILYYRYK
jgi:hypothetical protein